MSNNNSDNKPEYYLDKNQVKQNFDKAAESYSEYAVLQKEIASRLVERFDYITMEPQAILDIGAGTGFLCLELANKYPQANMIALDISEKMLLQLTKNANKSLSLDSNKIFQTICADAEQLPFKSQQFDLVISSLALQWCNDLNSVFEQVKRILKPGGLFMFTTFGPDTLMELRQSWQQVDVNQHVSAFFDMHDIGDALLHDGFAEPVMDAETLTLTYSSVRDLMRDLKKIGASNVSHGRAKNLTSKIKLKLLEQAYEEYRKDEVLPATYEIVYGHAWLPEAKEKKGFTEVKFEYPDT